MKLKLQERKTVLNVQYVCALLSLFITIVCLWFTFTSFFGAFERFGMSLKDVATSFIYYFQKGFGGQASFVPSVTLMPDITADKILNLLPTNFDLFQIKMSMFWNSLITLENLSTYGVSVGRFTALGAMWLSMLLPPFVGLYFLVKRIIYKQSKERTEDTAPLKIWKRVSEVTYRPVKDFVSDYINYVKEKRWIWEMWLVIWAFNFNLFTVVAEVLAFMLYVCVSFDFINLYVQFYKLGLDLSGMFSFLPWWVWAISGYLLFCRFRRNRGLRNLNHMEMRDRGYINSLSIVTMICGTMGAGKNLLEVDMSLSQSAMFRDKAYELILKNDMKFPYFPWLALETEFRQLMEKETVYNLASCRVWIRKKRQLFEESPSRLNCFGYDFKTYGLEYCDNLRVNYLWDVLESYLQEYFIFVLETSFLVSNYSVREDSVILDCGNFPMWNQDFFQRNPRLRNEESRFAHILDYDIIRLGKKVLKKNPLSGSLEFGILLLSEVGKERGNNLELKEIKKTDENANQKNDLLNWWLKMCRHASSVDFYPFIKVFTDEQRPESWGADARDLCQIVTIAEKSDEKLAMPFFFVEELLHEFLFGKFLRMYKRYRFERGDNSLFLHAVKTVVKSLDHYYERIYNRFGYKVLTLQTELGTQDGEQRKDSYYLMNAKTLSDRYMSDCFGDYFSEKALRSKVGLKDYPTFESIRASITEMLSEHGYFISELVRLSEEEAKPETTKKELQTAQEKGESGEAV